MGKSSNNEVPIILPKALFPLESRATLFIIGTVPASTELFTIEVDESKIDFEEENPPACQSHFLIHRRRHGKIVVVSRSRS